MNVRGMMAVAMMSMVALSVATTARGAEEEAAVELKLPKAKHIGTLKDKPAGIRLDPTKKGTEIRAPWVAPKGTALLSLKKPVTSSDKEPIVGALEQITDGDKEALEGNAVELTSGLQWVQIDLGKSSVIHGVLMWHQHADPRVYHDIIIQVSEDADFIDGVQTIYNNDADNSAGMGVGKAYEYIENYQGELAVAPKGGVKGRYVRLYSKGNTSDDQNHYTEVEVYGVQK